MRLTTGHTSAWLYCRLLLLSALGHCLTKQEADQWSYCEAETFKATCTSDQVVVMETGVYGRMRLGKCVQTDYGYVGCRTDVLEHLDSVCSGKRSCKLRIPDQTLDMANKCPKEFKTYLEANYTCLNVEGKQCHMCQQAMSAKVTGPSGYIASIVTNETETRLCGSSQCPWKIQVEVGQRINLTLFDFTLSTGHLFSRSETQCFRFAVIKENVKSTTSGENESREQPVCAGQDRVRHLYTSESNQIEITVISPEVFSSHGQFLFHYQALGCADIQTEPNIWFQRQSDVEATVGCVANEDSWKLRCVGCKWQGPSWQCPHGDVALQGSISDKPSFTLPLGVLIAIIIGIALVIGVLILTIGLVCLKGYVHRQQPVTYRRPDTYGSRARRSSAFQEEMSAATPLQYAKHSPDTSVVKSHIPLNIRENVYMESRPLPSIPNLNNETEDDKSERSSKIQVYRTPSGREHYHNPRLVVNTRQEPPYGLPLQYDPQYFVLDPDEDLTVELPPPCCIAPAVVPPSRRPGRGGVSSAKQKSPEEENAENFCKEVASINNSCHEIPLRLSPVPAPPVAGPSHVADDAKGGNSSWP